MAAENLTLSFRRRRFTAGAALLLLAACAAPPPYQLPAPQPEPVPVAAPKEVAPPPPPPSAPPVQEAPKPVPKEAAEPPSRAFKLGPATQSLVTQARAQVSKGLLPGASGTLDRALRIEPQNPLLWIEVARLRLIEGDTKQAENCARRALLLGSADVAVRQSAGHLLADVLRALHRDDEAKDLEDQPWMN
jgi:tetratricopeptide (TPR) repeat protein